MSVIDWYNKEREAQEISSYGIQDPISYSLDNSIQKEDISQRSEGVSEGEVTRGKEVLSGLGVHRDRDR